MMDCVELYCVEDVHSVDTRVGITEAEWVTGVQTATLRPLSCVDRDGQRSGPSSQSGMVVLVWLRSCGWRRPRPRCPPLRPTRRDGLCEAAHSRFHDFRERQHHRPRDRAANSALFDVTRTSIVSDDLLAEVGAPRRFDDRKPVTADSDGPPTFVRRLPSSARNADRRLGPQRGGRSAAHHWQTRDARDHDRGRSRTRAGGHGAVGRDPLSVAAALRGLTGAGIDTIGSFTVAPADRVAAIAREWGVSLSASEATEVVAVSQGDAAPVRAAAPGRST